ncbi:MAG: RNA methyltransferase [Clostridia bacterium]|nr:RNA methyltransferase [Clostridia bacterium]
MVLTSKNNPLIKETAGLKDKKGRKQTGLFLVEGVKMAKECAKSGFCIERVFVVEGQTLPSELSAYADKTVFVSQDVLRFLSDEKTPQGVLCRVQIPQRPLEAPTGACLFLDGVSDPGNVGAIVRSANAAGYNEIYLSRDCADPYSPKSVRASMSGLFFTKLYEAERAEILSLLREMPLIVADMCGENAFAFKAPKKFALVIGNEANGVCKEVASQAAYTVKIPMRATQESLNASVSAGILMYVLKREEFTR